MAGTGGKKYDKWQKGMTRRAARDEEDKEKGTLLDIEDTIKKAGGQKLSHKLKFSWKMKDPKIWCVAKNGLKKK